MNEYVLLGISIISGIFGLIGIQLLQQNWFKREDLKFKYDVKRARFRSKNVPVKKTSSPTGAMDWIAALKTVDPDVLHGLINGISGGGSEDLESEGSGIEDSILNFAKSNPEMVKKFLDGVTSGSGDQQEQGSSVIR